MCDNVAAQYDVYKVATIGDAYLVASGVPVPNGDKHAAEICSMALTLLDHIKNLVIANVNNHIEFRIGVHTGPCVGAVVGQKTPRYLLFGM